MSEKTCRCKFHQKCAQADRRKPENKKAFQQAKLIVSKLIHTEKAFRIQQIHIYYV